MGVVPGACLSYSAPKVDVPRKKDLGGSCRREVIYIYVSLPLSLTSFCCFSKGVPMWECSIPSADRLQMAK